MPPKGSEKRHTDDSGEFSLEERSALEERGKSQKYRVNFGGNIVVEIIARAYPSIGQLFGGRAAAQVLRRLFRSIPGYCVGPSVDETPPVQDGVRPDVTDLETEHPIDVKSFPFLFLILNTPLLIFLSDKL